MTDETHSGPGAPLATTKHHLRRRRGKHVPKEIVIAIADTGSPPRKAAHLTLGSDGSLYFGSPYFPPTPGVLFKFGRPHVGGIQGEGYGETAEKYLVNVPVKLSLHPSGLVQFSRGLFSRDHIKSGMDDAFWQAKGLGIHCPPLWQPITTGPTFVLVMFELNLCKQWTPQRAGFSSLVFEEGDFHERDEHDNRTHAYQVECFVFPAEARRDAEYVSKKGWVLVRSYSEVRPDLTVQFRVVDMPTADVFVGVLVSRMHVDAGESGYSLTSPADLTRQFHIGAGYPADAWGGDEPGLPRLDLLPLG